MIGLTGNWAFAAEQLSSRPASAAINEKKNNKRVGAINRPGGKKTEIQSVYDP